MTTNLTIHGMTCGHCQHAVTKALKGVPGVTDALVDLEGGSAAVHGDATFDALAAAVEDAGYEAQLADAR